MVDLCVGDAGPGKIISAFFSAFSLGEKSSGLGLDLTRSTLELHGGELWFENCAGRGDAGPSPVGVEKVKKVNTAKHETRFLHVDQLLCRHSFLHVKISAEKGYCSSA